MRVDLAEQTFSSDVEKAMIDPLKDISIGTRVGNDYHAKC